MEGGRKGGRRKNGRRKKGKDAGEEWEEGGVGGGRRGKREKE